MKFQMLNEEGEMETFQPIQISYCPNKPPDIPITVEVLLQTLQTAIDSNKTKPEPIWSGDLEFVKIWIPRLISQTIEQCAQIALDIAIELRGEADGLRRNENDTYLRSEDHQAATAVEIARRIRALLTDPQPQSPPNRFPLEIIISRMADQLEKWSRESRAGGWSTHQCVAMDEKAKELRAAIDNSQSKSPRNITDQETFTIGEIQCAIAQFLKYGEDEFEKSQQGYFSGNGFAARALRFHLNQISTPDTPFGQVRIHQEQAVIAALVEACKRVTDLNHSHYDSGSFDFSRELSICFEKAQDALALADTLKKGNQNNGA